MNVDETNIATERRQYFFQLVKSLEAPAIVAFLEKNSDKIKGMRDPIKLQAVELKNFSADLPSMRLFYIGEQTEKINPITTPSP